MTIEKGIRVTAKIIDGKQLAKKLRGEIAEDVARFREKTNCQPHLVEGLMHTLLGVSSEQGHLQSVQTGINPSGGALVYRRQRKCL